MSVEAALVISFRCKLEHATVWGEVLGLLEQGYRGAKVQDALDGISEPIADEFEKVWSALPCQGETASVFDACIDDCKVVFKVLSLSSHVELIETALSDWFALCPVVDLHFDYEYECS